MDVGAMLGIATPVLGIVVWAVRTEGRITTLKTEVDTRDEKLEKRLDRMEDKLDRLVAKAS